MARRRKPSYESWLRKVNQLVLWQHGMSIFELHEDIPTEDLRDEYERGISASDFVDEEVAALFVGEEDSV